MTDSKILKQLGNVYIGSAGSGANLSYTASPTQGQVNSDTGTDAILPAASGVNAGLFLPAEKTKLTGIEAGAEVNNISDVNATDLTDGGETALHTHDGRYYTETETNNLLNNKIDLNGNNSAITYANLTPSSAPTYQEGRIWYDTNTRTLNVYDNFPGGSIQLGKELIVDARNNTGSQINKGQAVYVNGALGQTPTIALAQANSLSTSELVGIADHNIANNTTGKVTFIGISHDFDTSSFTDGQQVYLSSSSAGSLTATPPASPNFVVFVGYVLQAHPTQGKLLVLSDRAMANNNSLGTGQTVFPTQNSVKQYVDTGLSAKENIIIAGTINQYYRGDKTFQTLDKAAVGLGNVVNIDTTTTANITDSANKRFITDAQQALLTNTSGTNTGDETTLSIQTKRPLKTIEGQSLEGSGNIDLTKSDVGLGNVDNTSDANKPISTATQTALDTKTNKVITTNRQTASYPLVLGDADKLVEMNVGSANNLTVPTNASVAFPVGTQILIAQYGAGQTTVVASGGVTIRSSGNKLKLSAQYAMATLIKIATDEWYISGDLTT